MSSHSQLRILKSDGVEFLRRQPDQSLDLVVATFAVHFMDRVSLDKEGLRVSGHDCTLAPQPSSGKPEGAHTGVKPQWPSDVVQSLEPCV